MRLLPLSLLLMLAIPPCSALQFEAYVSAYSVSNCESWFEHPLSLRYLSSTVRAKELEREMVMIGFPNRIIKELKRRKKLYGMGLA